MVRKHFYGYNELVFLYTSGSEKTLIFIKHNTNNNNNNDNNNNNNNNNNIRMDLEEIGMNAGNWVDSAQDRNYWRTLVNAALNLRVP